MLTLSDVKLAVKNAGLNFKIQTSELNGTEDSIMFIDECTKTKVRGKFNRKFMNVGEVNHWRSLDHDNIARLIDILRIHDLLRIYLTIHNEVTLKNIVHDKNFVHDSRCFDRKRSYARGIFSGLCYLHEKSLALMNLCDDNIIISKTDDKAIITNLDHLTMNYKATSAGLCVPGIYKAPETLTGDFDAINAEIWASGVLMLNMFLAHVVPETIVNYKAKKCIQFVDNISLHLFQIANAGSFASALDLAKFQQFVKCFFFKQNPSKRTQLKYVYYAPFLQNSDQYKTLNYSHKIFPSHKNTLPMNYANLDLPNEDLTFSLNPTYNPPYSSKSPKTQRREIAHIPSDALTSKTERLVHICENKTDIELPLRGNIKSNINVEKDKVPSFFPLYTNAVSIVDTEVTADLKETEKSCEAVRAGDKDVIEPSYDSYQSKSFLFIKRKSSSTNTITLKQLSKEKCCYLNSKPTAKQYINWDSQSSDLALNNLINNGEFDNNTHHCAKSNLDIDSGRIDVQTGEICSKIPIQHMQIETQNKQLIPYNYESDGLLQTFKKPIVKPPRNSTKLPIYPSSEVESVIVDFRAYNSGKRNENLSEMQNSYKYPGNRLPQPQESQDAVKGDVNTIKNSSIHKLKNANIPSVRAKRNYSYYGAIANAENNQDRKWEVSGQVNRGKSKKAWKISDFFQFNQVKLKLLPGANKMYEITKQIKKSERNTKAIDKINFDCGSDKKERKITPPNINYDSAIGKAENNRLLKISGQLDSDKTKKAWERNDFVLESKLKHEFIPATNKSGKMAKERQVARKTNEVVEQDELSEGNVKIVHKMNYEYDARQKQLEKEKTKTTKKVAEVQIDKSTESNMYGCK